MYLLPGMGLCAVVDPEEGVKYLILYKCRYWSRIISSGALKLGDMRIHAHLQQEYVILLPHVCNETQNTLHDINVGAG